MSGIKLRQTILNYVNEHQQSSADDAAAGLGIAHDTVRRAMCRMCEIGEMTREKALDERGQPYRYTAIAQTAEKVKFKNTYYERTKKVSKPQVSRPSSPGYYRHNPDNHEPYKNQGGQGSSAPRQGSSMLSVFW
jgi:hypothetical protein